MATVMFIVTCILLRINIISAADTSWIKKAHLVMSNHFDCGFDGLPNGLPGFAANVVNTYFDEYFPNAVAWGENFTSSNPDLPYTWMTQSWLISMYFDCPPGFGIHCPNQTQIQYIQKGINKGYIYWHGFPFNSQQEVYDISMLDFGLKLSRDLSTKYGAPISHVLSQRDVPGLTRSMIPILLRNNVTAVSIGVNGGSAPPVVPNIFVWNDTVSGESMIGLWNPGGYGSPSNPVYLKDFDEALVYCWRGDNAGPPAPAEVKQFYDKTKLRFPNATVLSSSITNFVDALLKNTSAVKNLPVINAEIGDTWSHGIGSDPWKTAINRAAQRERAKCLKSGGCSYDSIAFYNFSRLLMKNGEHTWGGDIKKFLDFNKNGSDYYQWSNVQLQTALAVDNGSNPMTTFRSTWFEQRNWGCYFALEALSMSTQSADKQLYSNIMKEWDVITNVLSPLDTSTGWTKITDFTQTFMVTSTYSGEEFEIQFDTSNTGALMKLMNTKTKVNYADGNNLLGEFIYATYTEEDFDYYLATYTYDPKASYMPGDFGKKGLDANAQPEHHYVRATFDALYQMNNNKNQFLVHMNFGSNQSVLETKYGAPQYIFQVIDFDNNRATYSSDIVWINKTATRLPEDYFYRFNPVNCTDWNVEKFQEMIDVKSVVLNGSMHMHATTGNVSCRNSNGHSFNVESIDAALSTFLPKASSEYSPFPVPFVDSDEIDGTAFILYDNTWGTNYPVWFPFDVNQPNATFRFNVFL